MSIGVEHRGQSQLTLTPALSQLTLALDADPIHPVMLGEGKLKD